MESKAKLFGHAIHPMLIVFPLGLLVTGLIFDIVRMISGNGDFATVSFWAIAAGIIGGLAAALFGLIDWLAIPNDTRAKSVGFWHGVGNVVVVVLFAASWFLRRGDAAYVPSTTAFVLALAGVLLGTLTAWLGGELVERLGVGVDRGAHLNAPSSLSGAAATSNVAAARREEPLREREVGR
jgi:uncharacterized membrane protein